MKTGNYQYAPFFSVIRHTTFSHSNRLKSTASVLNRLKLFSASEFL